MKRARIFWVGITPHSWIAASSASQTSTSQRTRAHRRQPSDRVFAELRPALLQPFLGEYGFLNPILAAAAMALSSATVLTNALRLRRVKVS
jgi:hypothetical protein